MSLQDLNNDQVSVSITINEILYNTGMVGYRVSAAIYDALSTFVRAYRSNMNRFLANRLYPRINGVYHLELIGQRQHLTTGSIFVYFLDVEVGK